jgi:hypothetical protein
MIVYVSMKRGAILIPIRKDIHAQCANTEYGGHMMKLTDMANFALSTSIIAR